MTSRGAHVGSARWALRRPSRWTSGRPVRRPLAANGHGMTLDAPPAARWTVSSASAALPRVSRCLGDLAARAGSVPHRQPPPHELRRSPLRVPRRNYCTSRVLRPGATATTIASQPRFGTGAVVRTSRNPNDSGAKRVSAVPTARIRILSGPLRNPTCQAPRDWTPPDPWCRDSPVRTSPRTLADESVEQRP